MSQAGSWLLALAPVRGGSRQVGAATLDRNTDVARVANGARLVDRQPQPLDGKLLENEHGEPLREGLDELELGGLDEGQHAFRHLLVVDSVRDIVGHGGAPAVNGQLEIDDHRLFHPALPIDEADHTLGREAAQKNSIAGIRSQVSSLSSPEGAASW